jgi:hypothetical protein
MFGMLPTNIKINSPRVLVVPGWFGKSSQKSHLLRLYGFNSRVLQVSNLSLTIAQRQLSKTIEEWKPDLILGNSRGGAVAMGIETDIPTILLAPAWRIFGVKPIVYPKTVTIIHSQFDDIVKLEDSIKLHDENPQVYLTVAGKAHTLSCFAGGDAIINEACYLTRHSLKPIGGFPSKPQGHQAFSF